MTRIEFWSAVMGLLIGTLVMYNQVNARFDRMQAETNARFDAVNARFDAAQVENARQHDALNRRFDELFEVMRSFERRISRLEGRLDAQGVENAEP